MRSPIDDAVEAEPESSGRNRPRRGTELAQRRKAWPYDLAVRNDLLLDLVDVAHALLRARRDLVDLLVDLAELQRDLVEDREAVVVKVVEELVEQTARAAREQVVPELLVVDAALEESRERLQLDGRQRDEIVRTDEHVELAGVQPADRRVVDGEVQDREEIASALRFGVCIHLRTLTPGKHVLDVERVPAEARGEQLDLLVARRLEVDPGEIVLLEFSERPARSLDRARGKPGAARADAW